jgi:hypothetical protein
MGVQVPPFAPDCTAAPQNEVETPEMLRRLNVRREWRWRLDFWYATDTAVVFPNATLTCEVQDHATRFSSKAADPLYRIILS